MSSPLTSPTARYAHCMATLGAKVVRFGGWGDSMRLDDTWEFDGATWTLKSPSARPPARNGHVMVTVGAKVVLFGGYDATGQCLNDTWEWDGTTWTLVSSLITPSGRAYPAMAALGDQAVLFGGWAGTSGLLADTWTYESGTTSGKVCETASDCSSGFCVDGVCCDTPCGNSDQHDCQACSVEAGGNVNGICALLPATTICQAKGRHGAKHCTGSSPICPERQHHCR